MCSQPKMFWAKKRTKIQIKSCHLADRKLMGLGKGLSPQRNIIFSCDYGGLPIYHSLLLLYLKMTNWDLMFLAKFCSELVTSYY
jgi:hypothetical protein